MHNNNSIQTLKNYGWDSTRNIDFKQFAPKGCIAARIVTDGRGLFRCITEEGLRIAELSGSFRYMIENGLQQNPVVGDWCALQAYGEDRGQIELLFERRTVLHRWGGDSAMDDVGAANVDTVAVVSDIATDFNLRRTERFLANIRSGGAEGAIILSKADLVENPEAYRRRCYSRFGELPVYLVDSLSHNGRPELETLLTAGRTVALVGISGAGKSTLLNMLLDRNAAKTGEIRHHDGRGRHTTTGSQLYLLKSGCLVIDTPGVRTQGVSADGQSTEGSFTDIAQLAESCRFSDCRHQSEPGCAVKDALLRGDLEEDRYHHYLRLMNEAKSREEELRRRADKDRSFGKLRYQMRKNGRRGGFDGQ